MHYPSIVALIDTELERLEQARLILSTVDLTAIPNPAQVQRRRTPAPVRRTKAMTISASTEVPPLEALALEAAPAKQDARPTQAPRQRSPRKARHSPPREASALSKPAHAGPVFVPAKRVQESRANSGTEIPASSNGNLRSTPESGAMPTAEALARRWLQSSAE